MTRVIGVVSGKGGVGKTTVVANMGAALSHYYKKDVTIIDCNMTTSHLGLYLGMYYTPVTLNQVLKGKLNIRDAVYDHFSGVKLIPSSLSIHDAKNVDIMKLRKSLKKLMGHTDIIILDSAPGLGREALATMDSSDEILYTTTPHVPSTIDVVRCHQLVSQMGKETIGIVLNMVGQEKSELNKKEVEQLVGLPVISSAPHDKAVLRSVAAKVPLVMMKPNSPAAKEYIRLAGLIVNEEYKFPNIWDRLFKR